jgi:hypothetical protein
MGRLDRVIAVSIVLPPMAWPGHDEMGHDEMGHDGIEP